LYMISIFIVLIDVDKGASAFAIVSEIFSVE